MGIDTVHLRLRDLAASMAPDDHTVWGCRRTQWGSAADTSLDGRPTKRCGRVWECAPCAVPGMLMRRADIERRLALARSLGVVVLFATFTVPHRLGDSLDTSLDLLTSAYDRMLNAGRRGRDLRSAASLWRMDRTLQVDWTAAGWHPHFHVLLFLDPDDEELTGQQMQALLLPAWKAAVEDEARRQGRRVTVNAHGLDVRPVTDGPGLARYLTRLPSTDQETTGGFALLAAVNAHGTGECRCKECKSLWRRWREYVQSMIGRKRYWARALDAALHARQSEQLKELGGSADKHDGGHLDAVGRGPGSSMPAPFQRRSRPGHRRSGRRPARGTLLASGQPEATDRALNERPKTSSYLGQWLRGGPPRGTECQNSVSESPDTRRPNRDGLRLAPPACADRGKTYSTQPSAPPGPRSARRRTLRAAPYGPWWRPQAGLAPVDQDGPHVRLRPAFRPAPALVSVLVHILREWRTGPASVVHAWSKARCHR